MLNYVWLTLIVVGIVVAVATDWHDISSDKYQNGKPEEVSILFDYPFPDSLQAGKTYRCVVTPKRTDRTPVPARAELVASSSAEGTLRLTIGDDAPPVWKQRKATLPSDPYLVVKVRWSGRQPSGIPSAILSFDNVRFVKLRAVTNEGIIAYAKTAVELAIGLIGIMALWLGIMKIAEQAGLVASLARLLRPLMKRLFPDVPPDHPAMGAMIMNMAANMLGLSNAATPLGLKAMEELNKLNPRAGTATDAMCTFLVINTSNLQLIPATVIAVRAAAGSANPAEILGPVLLATIISVVIGVTVVKLLARLRMFKQQLAG